MTSIPPNNTSGLYGIDGNAIPVGNDVNANNINATSTININNARVATIDDAAALAIALG
jgi:hypothetical protein